MKFWTTAVLSCALTVLPVAADEAPREVSPTGEEALFLPIASVDLQTGRPCWIYCPDGSRTLVSVPSIPVCYDLATTTCGSCNWTIVSGRHIAECFDGEIIG